MILSMIRRYWARAGQKGQSSVEVLMTIAMLAIAAQAVQVVLRTASKRNVSNRDREIATEKAMEMLEELRSVILDGNEEIKVMDNYADPINPSTLKPTYKYTLTTRQTVTAPGGSTANANDYQTGIDPLSGNPVGPLGYTYVRTVEVDADTNSQGAVIDPNVRKIWVRVYRAYMNPGPSLASTPMPSNADNQRAQDNPQPLAQVFGMVHSLGAANQPNQVLDIYMLALESVPGWWSHTSDLIPLMNDAMVSLQARNSGLLIHPHWIQRMSFGRDMEYTPETNQDTRSDGAGAFAKTYVYPGQVQYNNGSNFNDQYYSLTQFLGRINVDGTIVPGLNYSIADQFNHAVQEPDEERLYQAQVAVANNNGTARPEMSWRMILDRMNSYTSAYPNYQADPFGFAGFYNSILVNLHGEMVPVPPLRNYSDGAKDPDVFWGARVGAGKTPRAWRAATHADRLAYDSVNNVVNLRVYAWDMNPPADPISAANEDDLIDTVTLFIPGANIGHLQGIDRMRGNSRYSYKWITNTASTWNNNGVQVFDGANTFTSSFVADLWSPGGGRADSGLRIRLYGVTPTARAYAGAPN